MVAFWDKFTRKPGVHGKRAETAVSKPVPAKVEGKQGLPAKAERKEDTREAYRVLLHPIVSEKAARIGELGQYVLAVSPSATRIGVARAVTALYGVRPVNVNIIRSEGKTVRFGRRMGREKDGKKAIVTLKKGERLALFESV